MESFVNLRYLLMIAENVKLFSCVLYGIDFLFDYSFGNQFFNRPGRLNDKCALSEL